MSSPCPCPQSSGDRAGWGSPAWHHEILPRLPEKKFQDKVEQKEDGEDRDGNWQENDTSFSFTAVCILLTLEFSLGRTVISLNSSVCIIFFPTETIQFCLSAAAAAQLPMAWFDLTLAVSKQQNFAAESKQTIQRRFENFNILNLQKKERQYEKKNLTKDNWRLGSPCSIWTSQPEAEDMQNHLFNKFWFDKIVRRNLTCILPKKNCFFGTWGPATLLSLTVW